jgi:hypothetical protein
LCNLLVQRLKKERLKMNHVSLLTKVIGLSLLGFIMSASAQSPSPKGDAAKFVGTWKLVSITGLSPEQAKTRGAHPTGMIIYDALGNMAVQIMPDRVRPKYDAAQPKPEDAAGAILAYTAYFGTYTVDEKAHTVTHHRKGNLNPGLLGDFVRHYELAPGDRLILSPVEATPPDHLTWERLK